MNVGRSFTACRKRHDDRVPAGRLIQPVMLFNRPAGTRRTDVLLQAVNDLPTLKRPAGTKAADQL